MFGLHQITCANNILPYYCYLNISLVSDFSVQSCCSSAVTYKYMTACMHACVCVCVCVYKIQTKPKVLNVKILSMQLSFRFPVGKNKYEQIKLEVYLIKLILFL